MKSLIAIMAISVAVNITDAATPTLIALEGVMDERQLAANIGEAEVTLFQRHLLNNGPNKNGWPTTAFWPRAARAVDWSAAPGGLTVNVNQVGVRQRYAGGEIHPTSGHQYLTIPAREEAYGRLAGEFNNLKVAYNRSGAFALVEADATQITYGKKNKKTGQRDFHTDMVGGGVYFWLVKSVYQLPDPNVIPEDHDIVQVAKETMAAIVDRIGNGGHA